MSQQQRERHSISLVQGNKIIRTADSKENKARIPATCKHEKDNSTSGTGSSQGRRARNGTNFTSTPGRAVLNWQSNLDKEIELRQLANNSRTQDRITSIQVLDEDFTKNSQYQQSLLQQSKQTQQSHSQHVRKAQTIMLVEKSKVAKLPLAEILQLDPTKQQSYPLNNRSSSQTVNKQNFSGRNAANSAFSDQIIMKNEEMDKCSLVQRQKIILQQKKLNQYEANVLGEATQTWLNTSSLADQAYTGQSQLFDQPRQATEVRLGNLISQTPENKQRQSGSKENKITNKKILSTERVPVKASAVTVLNQTSLDNNHNHQQKRLANCSMAENSQSIIAAVIAREDKEQDGGESEKGNIQLQAVADPLSTAKTNTARHHRSLGRIKPTRSAAPQLTTKQQALAKQKSSASVFSGGNGVGSSSCKNNKANSQLGRHIQQPSFIGGTPIIQQMKDKAAIVNVMKINQPGASAVKKMDGNNWGLISATQHRIIVDEEQLLFAQKQYGHQKHDPAALVAYYSAASATSKTPKVGVSNPKVLTTLTNNINAKNNSSQQQAQMLQQQLSIQKAQSAAASVEVGSNSGSFVCLEQKHPQILQQKHCQGQGYFSNVRTPMKKLQMEQPEMTQQQQWQQQKKQRVISATNNVNHHNSVQSSQSTRNNQAIHHVVISSQQDSRAIELSKPSSGSRGANSNVMSNKSLSLTNNTGTPQQQQVVNQTARTPLIKLKVFDGGSLVGGDAKVGVSSTPSQTASANKITANNNVFHANPMPTSLKKMSNANQSLDRYMQRTNNAKSERTILTKHSSEKQNNHSGSGNFKTLNNCGSEDAAAGLQFQSLESVSLTAHNEETQMQMQQMQLVSGSAFANIQNNTNQAIFKSLEVLEECSNEGNSPGIKRKKAEGGVLLRHCSSSPTNFINKSRKQIKGNNMDSSSFDAQSRQSKTMVSFNSGSGQQMMGQITLTNQKNKVIRMRDPSNERNQQLQQSSTVQSQNKTLQPYGTPAENPNTNELDTSEFKQLTHSITELQYKMNGGVFIGGTSSNLQPAQQVYNNQQPSHQQQFQQQTQLPRQSQQQAHRSSSSSIMHQQHQQSNNGNNQQQQQQQQWRQTQQQQHHHQQQQQDHHHQEATEQQHQMAAMQGGGQQFRGVGVNGQNHPPHLSQQAQQMLQHKFAVNQNNQSSQQPQQYGHHQIQANAVPAQQQMVRHSFHGASGQPQPPVQQQLTNASQQSYQQYVVANGGDGSGTQQQPTAPYNSKAQTQKVVQQQQQQSSGGGGAGQKGASRVLKSATAYKQTQQQQQQQQHLQQQQQQNQLRVQLQGQQNQPGSALSPNAAGNGLRPGSNHRVLVPVKQPPPQHHQEQQFQQISHQIQSSTIIVGQEVQQQRQPTAQSVTADQPQQLTSPPPVPQVVLQAASTPTTVQPSLTGTATGLNAPSSPPDQQAKPRTYKEIRQRLHQQQQMQQLRLQQQQWIARQQQILLANNPGATIEQVNAIIQQSIINQQQQMALQQQQAQLQALQQASITLQAQSANPTQLEPQAQQQTAQGVVGAQGNNQQQPFAEVQQNSNQNGNQAAVFPNGSLSAAAAQPDNEDETEATVEQQNMQQRQQPQIVRLTKRQTGNLTGAQISINQQVQIKQHGNGQMSIGLANAGGPQQTNTIIASQLTVASNPRNHLASSQQTLPTAATTAISRAAERQKDENLMSYAQLLKNECQYEGGPQAPSLPYKPNYQLQQNQQPTNLPLENLKHTLQQLTSEILRKVLARSDSMNQLRQIIDLKAKKVKPKNYESSIFQTIMDKESTRVKQEADSLAKQGLRVEDKTLIKYLRGQVKKMLKPFRGLQYDDYLNNEVHLNEIMATQDQQNDPIKESRKRHLRILDAALKEQVVDIHIVLGICVQISRQAFYNELQEYFACAYDYIMANQAQFQQHDIQGITNLKKKLGSVRSNSKVQIQTTKKLDRMFWLLLEQNQEVRNNIRTYKERYNEKTENGGNGSQFNGEQGGNQGGNHLNSASHLQKRHNNNLRSSSGINTASPKVNAGGSSHNVFQGQNQKGQDGSVRRIVQKGARSSNNQQDSYNGGKQSATGNKGALLSQSQEAGDGVNLHATAGKAQQLLSYKNGGKNSQLAPMPTPGGKKTQSLIQKKMKARDLDRQLNSQQPTPGTDKTPDHKSMTNKRRMSSTKAGHNQLLSAAQQQHTSATPGNFHPRSRTKGLNVINSNNVGGNSSSNTHNPPVQQHSGAAQGSNGNNSTENLFNLIQATKTKNTMILEPLSKRHNKNESIQNNTPSHSDPREEIGSGLHSNEHGNAPLSSQKSHRMRQTDYSRGFMSNLDMEQNTATAEMDPSQVMRHQAMGGEDDESQHPTKVFRSWSRPQIGDDGSASQKIGGGKVLKSTSMQVCTCARFRKRIEPPMADISVAPLVSGSMTSKREMGSKANSVTAKSDLAMSPDHPRLRSSVQGGNVGPTSPHQQDTDYAKSEYKVGRLHSQEEILSNAAVSPNDRKNQPRMSQDFKMRILTKKKVAVPASATSQSRSQFNQSNASSASLEPHHKLLGPNRQISGESCGSTNQDPTAIFSDKNTASILQRSKIVTYELCQECGGQRPAGLPQVTSSSLSEIKVKLQVSKVSGYQSSNEEEFPGTARLNDSGRSSTLSLGNRDGKRRSSSSARHRSQEILNQYLPGHANNNKQALLGQSINLERVKDNMALEQCLNRRYLNALGVQYYTGLQEFIANSRAQRIQIFYTERLAERVFAARIIQHRWKLHKKGEDQVLLRRAKLQHLRKKIAINRIYDLHRLIKVRKVTANSQLIQHQLWQQVGQSQETLGDIYLQLIVLIQRKWRAILSRKYLMGKALVAKKQTRQRIWNSVMGQKYRRTQCLESRHLYAETMFMREKKNLEGYFWKQMVGYAKDLETRGAKIEQRLNSDFVLADWTFDTQAREWQNSIKSMTIKLEKHEPSQVTVLRDRLVKFYVSNQLPSETAINRQLDEFQDGRTAMQKQLKKEQDYKKRHVVQRIKRQRLENLFEEEPDILVEHV